MSEDEADECHHEQHEDGYCLDCGAEIEMQYKWEHDSNDMDR